MTYIKMSITIHISSNDTVINTNMAVPIELDADKEYGIALKKLMTYNSFPNIIEGLNNTINITIEASDSPAFQQIKIPTGSYELRNINTFVTRYVMTTLRDQLNRYKESFKNVPSTDVENFKKKQKYDSIRLDPTSIIFEANFNTERSQIIINRNSNIRIQFGDDSIKDLLGFNNRDRDGNLITFDSSKVYISDKVIDINHVNTIRVTNSLVTGSIIDGAYSNVIYSFYPSTPVGYKIVEVPNNPTYYRLLSKKIWDMKTTIMDQDGHILTLQGEPISIEYEIKEIVSKCKSEHLLERQVSLLEEQNELLKKQLR
ncbi:TPA_asm: penton [Hydra adintovirus]|nr:TPA_asm: penton [Hydra adintovirus]